MKKLLVGLSLLATTTLSATGALAQDKSISIAYVQGWDDSVATANVVADILKTKLNYDVQLKPMDAAIMWQGIARGDVDLSLAAWLPVTHEAYYKRFKNNIEELGTNYEDAKIGLVVPDYMETKSLEDLEKEKDQYGGTITGIDPGAGIMQRTDDAVKAYNLSYKVMPSSGTAMTVALTRAEAAKKPIVVTGWLPHWMFAKWKLHFLEDPKGAYGKAEHIDTIARKGFSEKDPDAAKFLKNFKWGSEEIGQVMLDISNGTEPDKAASKWVAAHGDEVNKWVQQ